MEENERRKGGKKMQIVIPRWLKEENPMTAGFCELINETLKKCPKMSLEEFAGEISKANVEDSFRRIQRIERAQFGGDIHYDASVGRHDCK